MQQQVLPAARLLAPHELLDGFRQIGRVALERGGRGGVAQPSSEFGDVAGGEQQQGIEVDGDNLEGAS